MHVPEILSVVQTIVDGGQESIFVLDLVLVFFKKVKLKCLLRFT